MLDHYLKVFKWRIIPMFRKSCKNNSCKSRACIRYGIAPLIPARAGILLMMCMISMAAVAAVPQLPVYAALGGDFSLTDTLGKSVSLRDWQGKVMILTFGFTACPHICPTTLMELSKLYGGLGDRASQVQIVFISIDPKRDTPEHLRRYLLAFQANIVGLTGSEDQLRQVAKLFGAVFNDAGDVGEVSHSDRIYLLDAKGQVRQIYAREEQFDQLQQDVLQLLQQRGFCHVFPLKISTLCNKYLSS